MNSFFESNRFLGFVLGNGFAKRGSLAFKERKTRAPYSTVEACPNAKGDRVSQPLVSGKHRPLSCRSK